MACGVTQYIELPRAQSAASYTPLLRNVNFIMLTAINVMVVWRVLDRPQSDYL